MKIPIVSATGRGPTTLAAFDDALVTAGIADRNLIYLSSVLPPGSVVEPVPHVVAPGGWGDRLYCVKAELSTAAPDVTVCAGIGWVQDGTGRGLLVEHHATSLGDLHRKIDLSLDALVKHRPGVYLPHRGMVTTSATCQIGAEPVSALVVAVFEAAPWNTLN